MTKPLNEKLIQLPGKNPNDSQLVITAGPPGSGKNFVIDKFTNATNLFKELDVDKIKLIVLDSEKLSRKFLDWVRENHPDNLYSTYTMLEFHKKKELLKDPQLSTLLHNFVTELQLPQKRIDLILKNKSKDNLPNIIVNTTFGDVIKSLGKIEEFHERGYKPENTHMVWVFNTFGDSLKNNFGRLRREDEDYIKDNYRKIFRSLFYQIIGEATSGRFVNMIQGNIWVVLNRRSFVTYYPNSELIDNFYYIKVREKGKWDSEAIKELTHWIEDNIKSETIWGD